MNRREALWAGPVLVVVVCLGASWLVPAVFDLEALIVDLELSAVLKVLSCLCASFPRLVERAVRRPVHIQSVEFHRSLSFFPARL